MLTSGRAGVQTVGFVTCWHVMVDTCLNFLSLFASLVKWTWHQCISHRVTTRKNVTGYVWCLAESEDLVHIQSLSLCIFLPYYALVKAQLQSAQPSPGRNCGWHFILYLFSGAHLDLRFIGMKSSRNKLWVRSHYFESITSYI